MSVLEAPRSQVIFGDIALTEMRASQELTDAILPLVRRACEYSGGRFAFDSIVDEMIAGAITVWILAKLPVEIQTVALMRVTATHTAEVLIGGAGYDRMLEYLPQLEKRAREQGCTTMFLFGRPRWGGFAKKPDLRALAPEWTPQVMIYERPLVIPTS